MRQWGIQQVRGQFLYPEHGQKQTFFDPLPPHLVHVVIEWPLCLILTIYFLFFPLRLLAVRVEESNGMVLNYFYCFIVDTYV